MWRYTCWVHVRNWLGYHTSIHLTMTWGPRCHSTNGIIIMVIKQTDGDYPEELMSKARKKMEEIKRSSLVLFLEKKGKIKQTPWSSSTKVLITPRVAIFHKPKSLSDGLYCSAWESPFLFFFSALLLIFSLFSSYTLKESHITKETLLYFTYKHFITGVERYAYAPRYKLLLYISIVEIN